MREDNKYVIIMAGGIGSRFWPVSRQNMPKQFIDILGTGKSLIRQTFERFAKIVPQQNIFVVTNQDYVGLVREHIPQITADQILAEPMARNTAPCMALASYKIKSKCNDAVCIVAPSDHLILHEEEFKTQVIIAFEIAETSNKLITFGIEPSRPDTGYGYIQKGIKDSNSSLYSVKTFTEKPTEEIAKSFLETGEFLWNAGIFCWSVNAILARMDEHLPEMNDSFSKIDFNANNAQEKIRDTYDTCQSISLDYGILEKDKDVWVLPSDFGWSDLGTWKSVWDTLPKENGNAIIAPKKQISESKNNLLFTDKDRLIVLHGVENLAIVECDDVLLIMDKNREQELRKVLQIVKKEFPGQYD